MSKSKSFAKPLTLVMQLSPQISMKTISKELLMFGIFMDPTGFTTPYSLMMRGKQMSYYHAIPLAIHHPSNRAQQQIHPTLYLPIKETIEYLLLVQLCSRQHVGHRRQGFVEVAVTRPASANN